MKKLLLISMFASMPPLSLVAQVDDLYFVPKKKSVEKVTDNYGMPTQVYYSGSDRSVDEYNRRVKSRVDIINNDSTICDTISFTAEKGVYPNDSISGEDFKLTRKMSRFDDYQLSDNAAFWAGYEAGRYDWAWHSPWYYSRYGWYGGWYDPWFYSRYNWYGGWYGGWYDPWYYSWYSYGWYDPWFGHRAYDYWYYDRYYPTYAIGGSSHYHAPTIGAGTIRSDGTSYGGYRRGVSSYNSSRMGGLRNRTVNGSSRNGGTNRSRTNSGNSRHYSSNGSTYNSGSYNNSSRYSNSRSTGSNSGSFSSSRSSSSSSGSFSSGSRGGGGSSRMGGRR